MSEDKPPSTAPQTASGNSSRKPMVAPRSAFTRVPASVALLKIISVILPTDYLRTFVFLNLVQKPRRFLRTVINSFYRMEHIYDVLREFSTTYKGNFSVLEFGVASGYTFTKMLYATKYLGVEDRFTVHGFDSFEGMHETSERADKDIVTDDNWAIGQFKSSKQDLHDYCASKYSNFRLHKGMFGDTITDEFLAELEQAPPVLVWIDCDYYTSARTVMEKLIPALPNGCVIYFDEPEFNYGSRFTGEMRLIHEINRGLYGEQIELVEDPALSLASRRIYRFINAARDAVYEPYQKINSSEFGRQRGNDSPLP